METQLTPMTTLERINTPPAQTWNYLKTNDITVKVPNLSRKGDVYFALPHLFDTIECGAGDAVSAWVTSQAKDAVYIEVRAGERRPEPIVIDVTAHEVTDTGIMVRSGAEVTVCVVAHATEPGTSAALLRIFVERDATLNLFEYVTGCADHTHIQSVGIRALRAAHVNVHQYFLGAGTTVAGIATELAEKTARIDHVCRYLARDTDVLDLNHVVRQKGERTRADIFESGALDGAAKKALRATIDLVHGAKGAEGAELESVLVLSDDVTNKTMPVILCDEDDVAGNHGATIGSPATDQIDYLRARGLTRDEAEALFVRAIFDDALIAAATKEAQDAVLTRAEEVLGPDIAHDIVESLSIG